MHLLHRILQLAHELFQSRVEGATLSQFVVLIAAGANQGASQLKLSALTGIDRSTLGQVINRLCRKGLMTRQRNSKDARAYAITLTSEGHRLLQVLEPRAMDVDHTLLCALPRERRAAFLAELANMVQTLAAPPTK